MNPLPRLHSARRSGLIASCLVWGLLAAFWFGQTGALVHETEHPFHEHTVECDVYQALSQPLSGDGVGQAPQSNLFPAQIVSASLVVSRRFSESPVFYGRAPPFS
jgi:hypothetical protein